MIALFAIDVVDDDMLCIYVDVMFICCFCIDYWLIVKSSLILRWNYRTTVAYPNSNSVIVDLKHPLVDSALSTLQGVGIEVAHRFFLLLRIEIYWWVVYD